MPFFDEAGNEITYSHRSLDCPELLPAIRFEGQGFTCTCGRLYVARHVWPGAPLTWYHRTPVWSAGGRP
jgi:hypothetical protein